MRIVKQNPFKNLGELHKEWTEAGVKASRVITHRCVKEFGNSCHQGRLTWTKEEKNWTVAQCFLKTNITCGKHRLPRNLRALHASFC